MGMAIMGINISILIGMFQMHKQIKVSKQFLADFETVTKHYGFPAEDIEFLKNKARADYDKTRLSLEIIANEVRKIEQFEKAA